MGGLFYPTENLQYNGELAYYRQREWRILGNMEHNGRLVSDALSPEEVDRLMALDSDFFGQQLKFRSGEARLVDQSLLMRSNGRDPIFATVRRVVAPGAVAEQVLELVRAAGFETPVVAEGELAAV